MKVINSLFIQSKEDGEFPVFKDSEMRFYLYFWKDSYEKLESDQIPRLTLNIDGTLPLSELKKRIHSKLKLSEEKEYIYLFKLDSLYNATLQPVFSSMDLTAAEIAKSGIISGSSIFVEEYTGEGSKFQSKISSAKIDTLVLFNLPVEVKNNISKADYSLSLNFKIKNDSNYGQVKAKIAELLGKDEFSFKIRKENHNGAEIKDLTKNIPKRAINLRIFVETGTPTPKRAFLTRYSQN